MADINIYGAVRSMTSEGIAAYASQVYDSNLREFQSVINQKSETSLQEITQSQFDAIFD